jgi:hypothetical protein
MATSTLPAYPLCSIDISHTHISQRPQWVLTWHDYHHMLFHRYYCPPPKQNDECISNFDLHSCHTLLSRTGWLLPSIWRMYYILNFKVWTSDEELVNFHPVHLLNSKTFCIHWRSMLLTCVVVPVKAKKISHIAMCTDLHSSHQGLHVTYQCT